MSNPLISATLLRESQVAKYIVLIMSIILVLSLILWIYNKTKLDSANCATMNDMYKDFGMVHTMNTANEDYTYNLRDYYIKTAYNACCAGQFKNDFVNTCALKNVIRQGARCLDLEIYSVNNVPVIATSSVNDYSIKETYNSVSFGDALAVIRDYAFSGSTCPNPGDPLILHLRIMSNNNTMYDAMATMIEENVTDQILGPKYSYENGGKNLGTIPISELMGKIVIIVDRSNPIFESTKLDEYVNLASNSIFMRSIRYSDGVKYTPDMDELIEYNKKNMSLVMPDLSSNNTNYSAQLAWTCGCQFVSMCFQNFDTNMEVYTALFDKTGSAFVLKPKALRYIPNTVPPPQQANPEYSYQERNTATDYYSLTI
jgi:hypothetical protein